MYTIHIAYLYYDLFNLYGENGNIKVLKKELENQGLKVAIHFLTIGDELNFNDYDLVYIGASTEDNQKLVIPHLSKYKDDIQKAIDNNKFFLITGNAIELFGKYILDQNNNKIDSLNIFSYHTEVASIRLIDESIMRCNFIDEPIIGFQNQSTYIVDNEYPMFSIIKGIGIKQGLSNEGIKYHNFYGTYLLGPILVRNPKLLKYFICELIYTKDKNFKFKDFDLNLNEEAYKCFINNFYQNIN